MDADAAPSEFEALDLLASMVAVLQPDGGCRYANAALENALGTSRRALRRGNALDWLADAAPLRDTLRMVAANEVACGRFDALLQRAAGGRGEVPVHVIVSQIERAGEGTSRQLLLEMIEVEQQARLDREERLQALVQANKELVRNLAHEIKNPLGGIRGAAQLLAMEMPTRELSEYTSVIIHEADRLQSLVDRLLAPHRRPQVVADVNIHEICERVRALMLAEFPRGLALVRDYDTSIPEFCGDREQLIQAVLNVARNAAQALAGRIARQVTLGRQRHRLALELHVEDNGPGVPEEIRDRIFQPLVSGRAEGSGLGLTLAQTFVQQHQGTIECDSVPGRTVFTMLIPLP